MDKKFSIRIDGSNLKLIRHPKKELVATAAQLGTNEAYSKLFPKNPKKDLMYVSAVSFTIGNINRNDCLMLPEEGISAYKTAIGSALNLEHEREDICGFCVDAYLSNMKNNKILSEDEAQEILASNGMVNAGVVLAVWRLNRPEVAEMLEDNFNEKSEMFNKAKLSFECYFNDFDFFVSNGSSNYPDGEVISSDVEKAEEMFDALRMNGGNGRWMNNRISICPKDSFIGGNAITMTPANHYSDIVAAKDGDDVVVIENKDTVRATTASEGITLVATVDNKPQSESVNKDTGEFIMADTAKIEDTQKVATAAPIPLAVDKDLADKLQSELDKKLKELSEKDETVKTLQANVTETQKVIESYKEELAKNTEMLKKIQSELDKEVTLRQALETKETERVQRELVASRMQKISECFEITEENKAMLEKECASASEEDFSKKLQLYKNINKRVVASEEKPNVKDAVKDAVSDTAKDTKSVNIIAAQPSESLTDKFAKAFNVKSLGYSDKRLID